MVGNEEIAASILRTSWDDDLIDLKEQFKIVLLSNTCHVMGISDICSGGFSSTPVDLRLIFATALRARCHNILLAHNHPSGALAASKEDLIGTKEIIKAGHLLKVAVSDHIILTRDGFYSMRVNGLMQAPYAIA